ncbi:MAG: hypothetical protein IT305_26455 [Chloroflexi bacterium]|nr:hypothetical protein [Chloroflexota bacterium]
MTRFRDVASGSVICETHHYEYEHGKTLAGGLPDPQAFFEEHETLVADPYHPDRRNFRCDDRCNGYRAVAEAARAGALANYIVECEPCSRWLAARP